MNRQSDFGGRQKPVPLSDRAERRTVPQQCVLRSDLLLHDQPGDAGLTHVVLEDPVRRKFYRLGAAESQFIRRLRETACIEDAISSSGHNTLSESQARRLCQWLSQAGLTEGGKPAHADRVKRKSLLGQFFFLRVPLCNPDVLLAGIHRQLGWAFSLRAAFVGMAVAVVGLVLALMQWQEFLASYENLFSPWRGLWLLITWIGLKFIHEVAHGVCCKRYGGSVPEAGLALIVLVPIAYVDVTSCWRFRWRWQRLHVTLAGVVIELFLAGIAMIVWTLTDSMIFKNAAADVVLLASVTSLAFNLNPLLKFDGYFALADLTGVDNLYQHGQAYARYFGKRFLLGMQLKPPSLPKGHALWIKWYANAAALWRAVTLAGLLAAAASLFAGAGIAIAIAGGFAFVVQPLILLAHRLIAMFLAGELLLGRLLARLCLISSTLALLIFVVPADWPRATPGVVEYDPPVVLRAPVNGFVETVLVQDGQTVVPNQPIVVLRNDDLVHELSQLRKQLAQAEQNSRSARWTNDSSKLDKAQAEIVGLQQQIRELDARVSGLIIRAPRGGKLVSRQLQSLPGTYLKQGEQCAEIGNEASKRLKISLSAWDASHYQDWKDRPIYVFIPAVPSWKAGLSHIESRASTVPPDLALTATHGGSLPMIKTDENRDPVLCEPRVNAYIALDAQQSLAVRCGQRGYVRTGCNRQSIGQLLWSYLESLRG